MKQNFLAQVNFNDIYNRLHGEGVDIKVGTRPIQAATPADLISTIIPYLYVIAGLILFAFLIIGGFGYLTSGGDPEKIKAAGGKITHALIGFLIIFLSYWLVQILEIVLGIQIF